MRWRHRKDDTPAAAQVLRYQPRKARYVWLDCLGRRYASPETWFYCFRRLGRPIAATAALNELEERVSEWWRPAT